MIDLSGEWSVRLDPQDVGETEHWYQEVAGTAIQLPGIATEVELGEALELEPSLTKEVLQHLHQRFRYIGAAWYTKRIVLPSDWESQDATLLLERSIWKTTVWVNGQEAGSEDSLSTAHRHSVGRFLRPGENFIAIRVDNRAQVNIGTMGHAYTDQTQTIWNGVIGRIELRREAAVRISRIRLAPQPAGDVLPLKIEIENRSGKSRSGALVVQAIAENHDAPALPVLERNVTIGERGEEIEFTYPLPGVVTWSEFNPALYRLVCRFDSSEKSIVTGFRTVETIGRQLQINGRPSFMRGTLECCIFPTTGYPAMDVAGWNKIFRTAKDFGLNHLRFHSWCPPEAAFAAADRHGVYLQVELPNWTFNMGQRPEVDDFLTKEGERIITEYAHHPSFVFFSLGNELTGDYAFLDRMIEHFRSLAPHLLYTSTTYSFSQRGALPGPADDFFVSQKTQTGWVRGQGFLNQTPPNTTSDYLQGLECLEIPLITHEVGQYNVYPNLTELPKYDGNLRALNFEAIRLDLEQKRRLDDANDYTLNSGKLAALLYKEDIERALRTPGLSGIQLLDLHDFPGQSTATVGLLDAFWDSKGIVNPEEFRRHCGAVVPLLRMPKRTWRGGEIFTAQIEIANFGEKPLDHCSVQWKIEDEAGSVFAEETLDAISVPLGNGHVLGSIEKPLGTIKAASKLTVSITIVGTEVSNQWDFWVYPDFGDATPGDVVILRRFGKELFDALQKGERVLLLPRREEIREPLDGRFIPVFWSPLHFPDQPGSLGAMIDADHPLFAEFPTSTHTDWQWWELLATSTSVNCDLLGGEFTPIMRFIDKYNRNSLPVILWETQVGGGKLLVCTLDIESRAQERIVAAQLKRSILAYMNSDRFSPEPVVDASQLARLFQVCPFRILLTKGTSHPDYPLSNLWDQKPETIWHTDWNESSNRHPYTVEIELDEPRDVAGLDYHPRPGSNPNGRIAEYRIDVSADGAVWNTVHTGTFPNDALPKEIRFRRPCVAARMRFIALSEVNGQPHCAIAELRPIPVDDAVDVEDFDPIEGFNTGRQGRQPNIVWIMAEDISTELSCYGHPAVKTPNLDRLAGQGARYTHAFCTAPSCTPSRNAMMTGVYQTRTDTQDQRRRGIKLPDGMRPITHLLRESGYYTALGCGYSQKTDLNFKAEPLFDGKDWSGRKEDQPFFAQITLGSTHRLPDGWDAIHSEAPNPVDPATVELPPYFPDHPGCRADWARYLEAIQKIDTEVGVILQRLEDEGIGENTVVIFIGDNGRCHLRGKCWLYDPGIHVPLIIRWPGRIVPDTVSDDMVSMIDVSATILDIAGVRLPEYLDGHPILGPRVERRDHIFAARDLIDEVMDHIRCVRTKRFKYIRNYTPDNGYRECQYVQDNRPMLAIIQDLHRAGQLTEAQQLILAETKPREELYDLQTDPHEIVNLAQSPLHQETLGKMRKLLDGWIADTQDRGLQDAAMRPASLTTPR